MTRRFAYALSVLGPGERVGSLGLEGIDHPGDSATTCVRVKRLFWRSGL
jgi:hypothetical protein